MEEIAQMREDLRTEAIRRQQDKEKWNAQFAAQMALLEESGRRNEAAVREAFAGELQAERASSHELREELDAANRMVACASAVGPAAAVEQKYVHKLTMMEFENQKALDAAAAKYASHTAMMECAHEHLKTELYAHKAASCIDADELRKNWPTSRRNTRLWWMRLGKNDFSSTRHASTAKCSGKRSARRGEQ
jgi:hypothetical protein